MCYPSLKISNRERVREDTSRFPCLVHTILFQYTLNRSLLRNDSSSWTIPFLLLPTPCRVVKMVKTSPRLLPFWWLIVYHAKLYKTIYASRVMAQVSFIRPQIARDVWCELCTDSRTAWQIIGCRNSTTFYDRSFHKYISVAYSLQYCYSDWIRSALAAWFRLNAMLWCLGVRNVIGSEIVAIQAVGLCREISCYGWVAAWMEE